MATIHPFQNAQQFSVGLWLRNDVTDQVVHQAHNFWVEMTIETTPDGSTEKDHIMKSLRAIDEISTDMTKPYWQRRLAYLQLHRALEILKQIVGHKRLKRQFNRSCGKGNSSEVIELYSNALHGKSGHHVGRQMRLAKRWSLALRNSLFLAVAYSDYSGARMKNFAVTHENLRNVSREAVQAIRQQHGSYKVFPI
ncbi:hypothetical protein HRG_001358 [Hirsutella rhossiliensis]|uniref:Uncharacterized protein n=1 Tax=Hirsutella rhossiliensis TaxID=111463 RepID=A0A9P8SN56_9HYPO|nr:uncharacterized protein HRG_01358 [Hirsutella rhossiliensis]KAH0968716.1 hypothetical protein HRG_01358 [Hirsutella rhossiliensis]